MFPAICVTRPVNTPYRFLASVRFCAEAPGKFAVVNSAFAGSLVVSTPNEIAGTAVWATDQLFSRSNVPPNVKLCWPLSQLSVSFKSQCDAFREEMEVDTVPLVRLAPF